MMNDDIMTAHTEFRKGVSVFVHMKDGKKFYDRYEEKKSSYVFLKDAGKVKIKDVRAISVFRGRR